MKLVWSLLFYITVFNEQYHANITHCLKALDIDIHTTIVICMIHVCKKDMLLWMVVTQWLSPEQKQWTETCLRKMVSYYALRTQLLFLYSNDPYNWKVKSCILKVVFNMYRRIQILLFFIWYRLPLPFWLILGGSFGHQLNIFRPSSSFLCYGFRVFFKALF